MFLLFDGFLKCQAELSWSINCRCCLLCCVCSRVMSPPAGEVWLQIISSAGALAIRLRYYEVLRRYGSRVAVICNAALILRAGIGALSRWGRGSNVDFCDSSIIQ